MVITDLPNDLPHHTSVIVSQSSPSQTTSVKTMGECIVMSVIDGGEISPQLSFKQYFDAFENVDIKASSASVVTILTPPSHGKLQDNHMLYGDIPLLTYVPQKGYLGDDKVVAQISDQGKTVKLVYILKVTDQPITANFVEESLCPKIRWKISSLPR